MRSFAKKKVMMMTMLAKKETVLLETSISIGEFDPTVDGAYRNVKTFPLSVKQGKKLFLTVESNNPVDIAISNGDGICIKFKDGILNDTIGPLEMAKKETAALLVGVFRGDKAELKIKAWME